MTVARTQTSSNEMTERFLKRVGINTTWRNVRKYSNLEHVRNAKREKIKNNKKNNECDGGGATMEHLTLVEDT